MTSSPHVSARDAALRKLTHINHWLIAGSLTLTGALSAVAVKAYPGETLKTTSSTAATEKAKTSSSQAPSSVSSSTQSSTSSEQSVAAPESSATAESSTAVVSGGS